MPSVISDIELKVLALAQNRQTQEIRTGDLVRTLGIPPQREAKVLGGMCRKGLAVRVGRGLYLVPPGLPPGGRWSPGEALALTTLMRNRDARFQICGPNAFHRYGWDEQVPNRVYVYNNRLRGDRSIGNVEVTLIHVGDNRLGDTEIVTTPEKIDVAYSSRARSLVDAVYDWRRFNSLPRAFGWIRSDLARSKISAADLVDTALKYGNQDTIRRLGCLLTELSSDGQSSLGPLIPERLIELLEGGLRSPSPVIPWFPTLEKRGHMSERWKVVVNGAIPKTT